MPRAICNGVVVAESRHTEVVEGNHYFPPEAIHAEYLRPSQAHTTCGWKGQASYYDLAVGDAVNHDAAWYYPEPLPVAQKSRKGITSGHFVRFSPNLACFPPVVQRHCRTVDSLASFTFHETEV